MKLKMLYQSFSLFVAGAITVSVSSTVDPPYEVGTWADFYRCAITHLFDSNMNLSGPGQDIFDERGER
jgi:hypothetical protein